MMGAVFKRFTGILRTSDAKFMMDPIRIYDYLTMAWQPVFWMRFAHLRLSCIDTSLHLA